jgi:hypothetical protein
VSWNIEVTDEFTEWYRSLTDGEAEAVDAAVEMLGDMGPALGRPFVDTITMSKSDHLKELRPLGGYLRVLFRFDPRRTAILLVGGDKTNDWRQWYDRNIPVAQSLYDAYIADLIHEGLLDVRREPRR